MGLWSTRREHAGRRGAVLWDSPCQGHPRHTYEAIVFTHNIKTSSQEEGLGAPRGLLLRGERSVTYTLPRGNLPLFVSGDKLFFAEEEEGHYFAMAITPLGAISLEEHKMPGHLPAPTACPEGMEKHFPPHLSLYGGYRCQRLWDREEKGFVLLAYEWGCP